MHECMIMASSNLLSLALFLALLSHANSATETSFIIDAFNKTNLILQGDATVSSNGNLQLSYNSYDSMSRAFYSAPIQIRDSTTGNVASFDTNFTMNIRTHRQANSAVGLDFVLVPVQPESKGDTVTVEFDTFLSRISIDVNNNDIKSVPWDVHDYDGQNAEVRITYNSSTKVFSVSLSNPSTGKSNNVSTTVELEKEVYDWVSVGFSATSGAYQWSYETHDVLSWSFSSKFINLKDQKSERSNIVLNKIL